MTRVGLPPVPDDNDARETPELDLAVRVADQAAEESLSGAATPPQAEPTWGEGPDADYRAAIDELALLVDMRRAAVRGDARFETSGGERLPDIDIGGDTEWGPFEIIERLGGGASGDVYKVRDKHLNNHVALKLFHRERVASVALDSLLVEGRQHALVKHPNIAIIHGADENDGRVGIWMEFIDGSTLQDLVHEQGTFGAAEAVNIARELCSALAAVHQQGLTHGDIKAQNVMREKGGRIVLMDFSSAREVELDEEEPGGLVGTPIYMAPELFDGKPSNFSSDIYALGVLLFYVVTGRHPYEAKNLKELKAAISSRKPLLLDDVRSDLPSGFVEAVERATAWNPEDRFQSAGQFQAAIREALAANPPNGAMVHPPQDLSVLVRAARVVTWSVFVTAFLAILGYSNEFHYNIALHIPHKFTNYSLTAAAAVGLRTLSFVLVYGAIVAVVLALLWAVVRVFGANPLSRAGNRLVERLRRVDYDTTTSVFTLIALAAVAGAIVYFADFLNAVNKPSEVGVDVSLLRWACGGEPVNAIHFALFFSKVILALGLGWFFVFEWLTPSRRLTFTARFMRWVSALAIVVAVGVMATPWRLLWQNKSLPIELGDMKGYIVAQQDDELYVYSQEAPAGQRHFVIQRGDARITNVGATPEYIFGEESCGGGGGS